MPRKYARRDWNKLEKEFILSDCKSISEFLKKKKIKDDGTTRKHTKGWNIKKREKDEKKKQKTIEKVIEKESNQAAKEIVNTKDTATKLLTKINDSIEELNKYFSRNTRKTKTVTYDYKVGKPNKEVIDEKEEINEFISIIDRSRLKQLTSALKDVNEVLNGTNSQGDSKSFATEIEKAWRNRNEQ